MKKTIFLTAIAVMMMLNACSSTPYQRGTQIDEDMSVSGHVASQNGNYIIFDDTQVFEIVGNNIDILGKDIVICGHKNKQIKKGLFINGQEIIEASLSHHGGRLCLKTRMETYTFDNVFSKETFLIVENTLIPVKGYYCQN